MDWACGGVTTMERTIQDIMNIYVKKKFTFRPHQNFVVLASIHWAVLEPEDGKFDWWWLDKNLTAMVRKSTSKSNYIYS